MPLATLGGQSRTVCPGLGKSQPNGSVHQSGQANGPAPGTTAHVAPSADQVRRERLNREVKEITTLYNIGVVVSSSLNLEEVVQTLAKESARLINTSNLAIVIYDDQASTINFALVRDRGLPVTPHSLKLSYHGGLIGRVLTGQTPLLVPDLLAHKSDEMSQAELDQQIRSWLGVPILHPGLSTAEGVIAMWSYESHAFTEHDLWLLSAIGTQAAIAIRNARLHEAVLAERDRVIEAEELARRALAHELHDGPTQLISAVSMRLDFCQDLLAEDPTQAAEELGAIRDLVKHAIYQMRTMLFELRPLALETHGLVSALHLFIERRQAEKNKGAKLTLKIEPTHPNGQISRQEKKIEAALFAIVQETVNNALKHAQAQNIVVQLQETPQAIYTTITDDGIGFDMNEITSHYERRGSLGLVNIRERADLIGGELALYSEPGRGTRITVRVPKAEAERKKRRGANGPLRAKREG
ncbi:MAG: GAF domain-containing sensor histidine kinase [Chloroflexi bacterium]|nr:GAF domain-containing sensor histidine kinase [Chloroflexota bacterium]